MTLPKTNMRVLAPSRKRRAPGDVFAIQVRDREFIFGRLVSTTARVGGFEDCHLVYIYRATSPTKTEIPLLDPHDLLVPPMATNQKPWTLGFFEVISPQSFIPERDVLPQHCFRDTRGRFFDDKGRELPRRFEPCGEFGLQSYRTIDDTISKALGLPLAPDEEDATRPTDIA
jgi:Immunity protein 26